MSFIILRIMEIFNYILVVLDTPTVVSSCEPEIFEQRNEGIVAVAVVAVCCWVGDNGGNVYYLPCPPPCSNNKTSFHISLVNAHVHPPPP